MRRGGSAILKSGADNMSGHEAFSRAENQQQGSTDACGRQTANTVDLLQHRVVRNPNFVREGRSVYFDLGNQYRSKKALLEISDDEIRLFDELDNGLMYRELLNLSPRAVASLALWHERRIIEFINPHLKKRSGPTILVIEPHMDDAALSVGGALLNRRDSRLVVLAVVRWSAYTSYTDVLPTHHFEKEAITALRTRESQIACDLAGAEFSCLNEVDLPLRFESQGAARDPSEVERLVGEILTAVRRVQPVEVWLPLGLGYHPDHVRTRDAALLALGRISAQPRPKVRLYEDLPYANRLSRSHRKELLRSLTNAGAVLVPGREDITNVMAGKVRMVGVYASQFKVEKLGLPTAAEDVSGASGVHAEAFYTVARLPLRRPISIRRAASFLEKVRRRGRLTVFSAFPIAAQDVERLASVARAARLTIYAPQLVGKLRSRDQTRVITARSGLRAWIRTLLREGSAVGTPTIISSLVPPIPGVGVRIRAWFIQALQMLRPRAVVGFHSAVEDLLDASASATDSLTYPADRAPLSRRGPRSD